MLEVRDLNTLLATDEGFARVVQDASFTVRKGRTLALVGESGSGKTMTALSILRLLPEYAARIESGQILFKGEDLVPLPLKRLRTFRGSRIAMVFQEPMTSLNPVFTVGNQVMEPARLHLKISKKEAKEKTLDLFRKVGIPAPEERFRQYPHELSGGMKQRVLIAMALICSPDLLIADEPTSALDVTIQAQILDLLRKLQEELHMSVLLITHDLGVVAEIAHDVAVMYASRIVERGTILNIFRTPSHPYTQALFESMPGKDDDRKRLASIPGTVPDPFHFPEGCKFHPRCGRAFDRCRNEEPPLLCVKEGHHAGCWLVEGGD